MSSPLHQPIMPDSRLASAVLRNSQGLTIPIRRGEIGRRWRGRSVRLYGRI